MTAIPNTKRRGAIYWYRRSRRLPCGNHFRPSVSLRTACPKAARRRAAILTAKFEDLYMHLFGNRGRRLALDRDAATRIFQSEFTKALDALDDEREHAALPSYEFGNLDTFLDVHEEVYRYLAGTNCSGEVLSADAWTDRVPHLDEGVAMLAHQQLSRVNLIWHQSLDETAEALENEQIETDIFYMDHAMRLRFEARVAAVQEYRRRMSDPNRRFESLLAAPVAQLIRPAAPAAAPPAAQAPTVDPAWASLTAEQAARKFISENPKLVASETGKREAKWTDKTKSQFESAMRLLQKSMGSKPFVSLSNEDLRHLLKHFDGLPPSHHKSPRHGPMTLAEICAEAKAEIAKGRLKKTELGLNVPTLNRHFRFLKMAHEWTRKQNPTIQALDWSAFAFEDGRSAREQREAFPVPMARKIYMDHWRKTWADYANAAMAEQGISARIDHRTLIEQDITDRKPGSHIGPTANAMEARGIETGRWLKDAWIWFENQEPWFEENRRYVAFLDAEEAEERRQEIEKEARQEEKRKELDAAGAIVARVDVLTDLSRRLDEAAQEVIGEFAVQFYSAAERLVVQARPAVERPALHLKGLNERLSLARPNAHMARNRLEGAAARLDKGIGSVLAVRARRLQTAGTNLDRARPTFAIKVAAARSRVANALEDVRGMASSVAAAAIRAAARSADATIGTLDAVILRTTSPLRNSGWRERVHGRASGSEEATIKTQVEALAPAHRDANRHQLERDLSEQRSSLLQAGRSLAARLSRAWAARKAKAEARAARAAEATLIGNMHLAEQAIRARLDHNSPDIELKFVRDWIQTMRSTEGPMEARYREADRVALRGYALGLDHNPRFGDLNRALIRLSPFAGGVDMSARHAPSELPEGMKPDIGDRAFYSPHVKWVVKELGHDLAVLNHMQKLHRDSFEAELPGRQASRDIDHGRYTRRAPGKGGWEVGGD